MGKFTPVIIVIAVVAVGIGGIFFLSNQKPSSQNPFDLSKQNIIPTTVPTSAIITQQPIISKTQENMDDFITTQDGLKYKDEKVGEGAEVKSGNTVTVNYLGTLENGTKFDSSYDRNQPFTTQIGVGQVIKGWDEGIVGMKVGGKRKLVIPADLGYGSQPAGSIPPNSILIFEVELLDVK